MNKVTGIALVVIIAVAATTFVFAATPKNQNTPAPAVKVVDNANGANVFNPSPNGNAYGNPHAPGTTGNPHVSPNPTTGNPHTATPKPK